MISLADVERSSVLILGLAREGISSYRFLRSRFPEKPLGLADRLVWEELDPDIRETLGADDKLVFHLGANYLDSLGHYELIFKAPGISPLVAEVVEAVREGRQFSSNTELFFQYAPGIIVGITGTKGKSTTTSLIHHVLQVGGIDARLTGNIGSAPLSSLADASAGTLFVAELSSHQLMPLQQSPHIAVVQNVVPEHLDYYGSFDAYLRAKENIVRYQGAGDRVVYNALYPIPTGMAKLSPGSKMPFGVVGRDETGCLLRDDFLVFRSEGCEERIVCRAEVPLKGDFNLQNVMPGVVVGKLFGLDAETIARAVRTFRPLAHRLEPVGEWNGISFYNDSLSTVPEAAAAALESFAGRAVVLIAGGTDRGLEFSVLARAILAARVRGLVLFPPTGERIWEALVRASPSQKGLPEHVLVDSMAEAVREAVGMAREGDVVLMSPASASFGLFRDYRDRGDRFRAEVKKLVASASPRAA